MRLLLREDAPGLITIERGEPGPWQRRLRTVLWATVTISFAFVPVAVANPLCYIPMVCEVASAVDFATDPLGFLLQKLTEANIWFLHKMLELMQNTTRIDLTSPEFLKQYAIIFAASSIFTVALWFIAVAKRAIRGVAVTTAVSEAIGFLLLQFVVNAMTPGAIALLMQAIDEVTAIFEPYAVSNFTPFLENVLGVMASNPSEGIGQLFVVNLVMLLGALLMWVELLIRSAAIYVAVALGPVVNAGLVDRDLWGKSKKWFGAIFAIGLSKPILFALLGLGGAILSDSTGDMSDAVSTTLVGALILLLAVFASATLYKWLPAFGDEMASLNHDRRRAQMSGPASAIDGPGQHANRAINSHVQDSLVRGRAGGSAARGTASVGRGGTAAAGPAGAAAAAAKAGVNLAKDKAAGSPGAQGAGASGEGPGQGQGRDHSRGATPQTLGGQPATAKGATPPLPSSTGAPGGTSQPAGRLGAPPLPPGTAPPGAGRFPSAASGPAPGTRPAAAPKPTSAPLPGGTAGRPPNTKDAS
ncbi:hypothetical protein [Streptomyces lonarensis]|uniref:hypothetical protein n=1 Tax=Streptomyces lonarensis TaxID=700599 RepID=UPI001FD7EABF|nr:hypothetical protein [Streptomyces lonarensis]